MSHDHDDFAGEPVPGLPERLPAGEHVLWQGAPSWWAIATRVLHVRVLGGYFLALMAWRGGSRYLETGDPMASAVAASALLPLGAALVGLIVLYSWATARTTLYTLTNRRVAMRIGIALTPTYNIPFQAIQSASVSLKSDGSGDISLALNGPRRLGYWHLWPHVRPFRLSRPEPMLRGIPDAQRVAQLLGEAAAAALPDRIARSAAPVGPAAAGRMPGAMAQPAH